MKKNNQGFIVGGEITVVIKIAIAISVLAVAIVGGVAVIKLTGVQRGQIIENSTNVPIDYLYTDQMVQISVLNNSSAPIDINQKLSNQLEPDVAPPEYTEESTVFCEEEKNTPTKGLHNEPVVIVSGETLTQKTKLYTRKCYNQQCLPTNYTTIPHVTQYIKSIDGATVDASILFFGSEVNDENNMNNAPQIDLISLQGENIQVYVGYNTGKKSGEQIFKLVPSGSYTIKTSDRLKTKDRVVIRHSNKSA